MSNGMRRRDFINLTAMGAALIMLSATASQAGEPSTRMAISGLPAPLTECDVEVVSADIDIRLPKPDGWVASIRMELSIRSRSAEPVQVRICVPLYGAIWQLPGPDPRLRAAVKLDGATLEYSLPGFEELAKPFLEEWAEKGWQLLGATDPELKAQLESLDRDSDQLPRGKMEALDALVEAHADRHGDRVRYWGFQVPKFLVFRHLYRFDRELHVDRALEFLDPQFTHDAYDLDSRLLEQWHLNVWLMRDPYDGRLYQPHDTFWKPKGRGVHVLEFDVTLQPGKTHVLAAFYRQAVGYERCAYRAGDLWSRQLCFVTEENARKWADWRWVRWTVRWPEGTRRISFGPRGSYKSHPARYWREGGYHNASYWSGALWPNQHIGWTRRQPVPRRRDVQAQ